MAIQQGMSNAFKMAVLQKFAEDEYKIALYSKTASINKNNAVYTPNGEASGAGYTAGGKVLTGLQIKLDGDTAIMTWNDPTWPNATIRARGAMIYDASQSDLAVAVLDFNEEVASTHSEFKVQLPAFDAANALIGIQ